MADTKLYKVLGAKAESIHGGDSTWHKPYGHPGKWMPKIDNVKCCDSGYHLVELTSLAEWLREDCTIYLAEGRGQSDSNGGGKIAYSQARLIRRLHLSAKDMRLFAADCADHVQHIWLAKYPNDDRPAKAIQAARDFANGLILKKEMYASYAAAAASSASSAAASSAATSAAAAASSNSYASAVAASSASASYASTSAYAATAASSAAYAAAAASAAAYAYASAAYARREEVEWQAQTLLSYLEPA